MDTFEITYNHVTYIINPQLFCNNSSIFQQIYSPEIPGFEMENNYPQETFKEFLNAVQNVSYQITIPNAEDLRRLAMEWKVEKLQANVDKFMAETDFTFAPLHKLLDRYSKHDDTGTLEIEVASNFNDLYDYPDFLKMDLPLMQRVLKIVFENIINFEINDYYLSIVINTLLDMHKENIAGFIAKQELKYIGNFTLLVLIRNEYFDIRSIADTLFEKTSSLMKQIAEERTNSQHTLDALALEEKGATKQLKKVQEEFKKKAIEIDRINTRCDEDQLRLAALRDRAADLQTLLKSEGAKAEKKLRQQAEKDRKEKAEKAQAVAYMHSSNPQATAPYIPQQPPQQSPPKQHQAHNKNQKNKKQQAGTFAPYVPSSHAAPTHQKNWQTAASPVNQNQNAFKPYKPSVIPAPAPE